MVDKKYKDFDAAVSEEAGEPVEFKIAGKEYSLPGQLPARVVLTQMRFMDEDGLMAQSSLPEWLESLVGKDNLEEMLDAGATWPQLDELLQFLLDSYGLGGDNEIEVTEEGEADPKA
tara:strand:- start:445 stop:795 length:351 start_codon:yes stop_codon:yes gene_type:complete